MIERKHNLRFAPTAPQAGVVVARLQRAPLRFSNGAAIVLTPGHVPMPSQAVAFGKAAAVLARVFNRVCLMSLLPLITQLPHMLAITITPHLVARSNAGAVARSVGILLSARLFPVRPIVGAVSGIYTRPTSRENTAIRSSGEFGEREPSATRCASLPVEEG
jgi:hypothetical protein